MSIRSREGLERALREMGLRCVVEAWDALAVAVPEPHGGERGFEDPELRRRAIELARAHGFSHLAVELRDADSEPPPRATLSSD